VTDPSGFSLSDLLLKASLNPESPAGGLRCERCGFTQSDFKKHGRFGCPICYDTFRGVVEPMLETMHNGTAHTGKIPHRAIERKSFYDRVARLELDLAEAIKSERYEDAARTRDEINQVKQAFNQHVAL
jgi:protein arginine kinase activator